MALTTISFVVHLVDGSEPLEVRCINPDFVAWERHAIKFKLPAPDAGAANIWTNFECWHALHREGRWPGGLTEFENAVLGIESATNGDEGDGVETVDPTQPALEPE